MQYIVCTSDIWWCLIDIIVMYQTAVTDVDKRLKVLYYEMLYIEREATATRCHKAHVFHTDIRTELTHDIVPYSALKGIAQKCNGGIEPPSEGHPAALPQSVRSVCARHHLSTGSICPDLYLKNLCTIAQQTDSIGCFETQQYSQKLRFNLHNLHKWLNFVMLVGVLEFIETS